MLDINNEPQLSLRFKEIERDVENGGDNLKRLIYPNYVNGRVSGNT